MVTVTVGDELMPPPPWLPADEHGDWPPPPPVLPVLPPVAVPVPLPPGQVATLPTDFTRPRTVEVPSGSTTDTACPALTRYSCVTGRSTVTTCVMPVAVSTPPPPPRRRRHQPTASPT